MENEYSKVKVNNEIDFCSVTEPEVKTMMEKAFMKARVSYFLRWEKPGLLSKIFGGGKVRVVFCINSAHLETADSVLEGLGEIEGDIKIIKTKSYNNIGF